MEKDEKNQVEYRRRGCSENDDFICQSQMILPATNAIRTWFLHVIAAELGDRDEASQSTYFLDVCLRGKWEMLLRPPYIN